MEGTTEDDWRDLVQLFSRIGYDLNKSAKIWWSTNKPNMLADESEPFVSYERQNRDGTHLKYPYLERFRDFIHSTLVKAEETISYFVLKDMDESKIEFELNF